MLVFNIKMLLQLASKLSWLSESVILSFGGGRNDWGPRLTVRLEPQTYLFENEAQYLLLQHYVKEVSTEPQSQIDMFKTEA